MANANSPIRLETKTEGHRYAREGGCRVPFFFSPREPKTALGLSQTAGTLIPVRSVQDCLSNLVELAIPEGGGGLQLLKRVLLRITPPYCGWTQPMRAT